MLNRRQFLKASGSAVLWPYFGPRLSAQVTSQQGVWVNDIHAQINRTLVQSIVETDSLKAVQSAIEAAKSKAQAICIAGGRHAMGGQQFCTNAMLIDTRKLNDIFDFDRDRGIIELGAGIQWPQLISHLVDVQRGASRQWAIAQKQTGADRLTIGGALAANVHGRGLAMKPFISDVESFTLVDADGRVVECSRDENAELFRLAVGGYGLFGIITAAKLRLVPRQKIRRQAQIISVESLMEAFEQRISKGFLYGDFQFNIDEKSEDFLRRGILSCYEPIPLSTPIPDKQKNLSIEDWKKLARLAHTDKGRCFQVYADHYLSTSGQVYWSDTHQLSPYLDNYHRSVGKDDAHEATEIISELYVPRATLCEFLSEVRADFRRTGVNLIYGTIRLIEKDEESFLAWAKQRYACIIFNLHTVHTRAGLQHSAEAFRRLIGTAIRLGGSYYLTYHTFATRGQVETCYPRFQEFLRLKKKYDPEERFQSNWYRHYRTMLAGA